MKIYITIIIVAIIVFIGGIFFIQYKFTPETNTLIYIPTIESSITPTQEQVAIIEEPEEAKEDEEIKSILINIERPMGLYNNIHGERIGHIRPTTVEGYMHEDTRWAIIYIDGEEQWINLDFEIPFYEIEAFFETLEDVSVYYENLESGLSISLDVDRVWFGASAVKAPFGLYIYQKASRDETDLSRMIEFTEADYYIGSGLIRSSQQDEHGETIYGKMYSQRDLLFLMLAESDNIALRMLIRHHGLAGYTRFVESLGANVEHIITLRYSLLTANDAGIFMRETYDFYASGDPYGEMLMNNLIANRYKYISSDYTFGSKSGFGDAGTASGAGHHDMAIVFAPSPYILCILSPWAKGQYREHRIRVFKEISVFIQDFNDKWF